MSQSSGGNDSWGVEPPSELFGGNFSQLRSLYLNLTTAGAETWSRLVGGLRLFDPTNPAATRGAVDRVVDELAPSDPPLYLGEDQLTCLKRLLATDELAAISPFVLVGHAAKVRGASDRMPFYARVFQEIDALRALQNEIFRNRHGASPRAAIRELLQRIDPTVPWSEEQVAALQTLLVEDVKFKALAPFPITGNFW